jgi:endonuclease YncB( thermonuclease family)
MLPALLCLIVGVTDGDTLTALCGKHQTMTVRLAEIDAPERRQAFGDRSRARLAELCADRPAEVRLQTRDKYGRTIARVSCAGVDVSAAMVGDGYAWAFTEHLTDPSIAQLESAAREQRSGLWAEPAWEPWYWRRHRRAPAYRP